MSVKEQFGFDFDQQQITSPVIDAEFAEVREEGIATPEVEAPSHVELEKNGQIPLINIGEWWEEHWKGMPEYSQEDLTPFHTVNVHFANREDMDKFALLVGQKIGVNTQALWYPEAEVNRGRKFVDAPKTSDIHRLERTLRN